MTIFKKLLLLGCFLGAVFAFVTACKGAKEIAKTEQKTNSLAAKNTMALQSNYLPQDKPFLDSLKQNLYNFDNGGYYQTFTYIDSVPPIVKEIFPNVIFYNTTLWVQPDAKPVLMGYYKNREYICINNFNVLYKNSNYNNTVDFTKEIHAFLYIILGFNSDLKMISVKNCAVKITDTSITCNYDVIVENSGVSMEFLIYSKEIELLGVFEKSNETFKTIYLD